MAAAVHAVQINEEPERTTGRGVTCIFCGLPTPVSKPSQGRFATHLARANSRLSIVRCHVCGKEAPYPVHEIVQFEEKSFRAWCAL
jgi:hypothetical protein